MYGFDNALLFPISSQRDCDSDAMHSQVSLYMMNFFSSFRKLKSQAFCDKNKFYFYKFNFIYLIARTQYQKAYALNAVFHH